ncbi:hypothetical protein ACFX5K_01055 [Rickettsiales bacterium LUAb2]
MLTKNNTIKILVIIGFLLLSGCGNTYYLTKKIDKFKPQANQTFVVIPPSTKQELNPIIAQKLEEKLSDIPLKSTDQLYLANYVIYFKYTKAYFIFPVLGVVIENQTSKLNLSPEKVYEATVFSYNGDTNLSIAIALKNITDDIVDMKYKGVESKLIRMNEDDLKKEIMAKQLERDKNKQTELKNQEKELNNVNDNKAPNDYKLFDRESDYKW